MPKMLVNTISGSPRSANASALPLFQAASSAATRAAISDRVSWLIVRFSAMAGYLSVLSSRKALDGRPSMGDHPRPAVGEALRSFASPIDATRHPPGTTSAAAAVRSFERGQRAGRVGAPLIGRVRRPGLRRNRRAVRRRQKSARRVCGALRAFRWRSGFRHRPHQRERTAALTEIVVDRHRAASLVRRGRNVDAALDVFGRPGGARHNIELENIGG